MLSKMLNVAVDGSTFPSNRVPASLRGPATVGVDLDAALLMLGSLTTPGGFSAASPARIWAWIRYFGAIATAPDLRVTAPFFDLDPHQKTILSDDFGVAVSTMWLYRQLGGLRDIVDGRRFLIQYASLVRTAHRRTRKVGPEKCPDYVALDRAGKWHVLECKGTQSSTDYRDKRQMKDHAIQQKRGIQVRGSVRGEQLVAGLYLSPEFGDEPSHLRVIDPPAKRPLMELEEKDVDKAELAVRRLAVSRALGLAGFNRASDEVALPPEREKQVATLYKPGEARRVSRPVEDRLKEVAGEVAEQPQTTFQDSGDAYVGREIRVEIPGEAFFENTGSRVVVAKQGVNAEVLERVRAKPLELIDQVDDVSAPLLGKNDGIVFETAGTSTTLRNGRLFLARIEFNQ